VNWNGNPIRHHAFAAESNIEFRNGFRRQSPLGKGWMIPLQFVQPELQGFIGRDIL
jgi:hypothetical protein